MVGAPTEIRFLRQEALQEVTMLVCSVVNRARGRVVSVAVAVRSCDLRSAATTQPQSRKKTKRTVVFGISARP